MRKYLIYVVLIAVVGLGTTGYCLAGLPFYESLLSSLSLLTLSASHEPTSLLIELSRWLGVLFVIDVVYSVVETALATSAHGLKARIAARRPNAVAIHGDGLHARRLTESIGSRAFQSNREVSFKAPVQVVMFSDDKTALDWCSNNLGLLSAAAEVYVALMGTRIGMPMQGNVYVSRMPEVCAQLYWEKHPVTTRETVVIIGDDSYAEALLHQALLVNLFSVGGGIEYCVFGDFSRYRALHPMLDAAVGVNTDTLVFHDEPWQSSVAAIAAASRIILCEEPQCGLRDAAELREFGAEGDIFIRCDSASCRALLRCDHRTMIFGTADELATSAIVIQQRQHDAGKRRAVACRIGSGACKGCRRQGLLQGFDAAVESVGLNSCYARGQILRSIDFNACLSCPAFKDEWQHMSEFLRQSNCATAAHDVQKEVLLAGLATKHDTSPEKVLDVLPQCELDMLLEIEHMRWCRFHYLHNWKCGPAPKCERNRTHPYLVAFGELPRDIKDFDIDSYATLFDVRDARKVPGAE